MVPHASYHSVRVPLGIKLLRSWTSSCPNWRGAWGLSQSILPEICQMGMGSDGIWWDLTIDLRDRGDQHRDLENLETSRNFNLEFDELRSAGAAQKRAKFIQVSLKASPGSCWILVAMTCNWPFHDRTECATVPSWTLAARMQVLYWWVPPVFMRHRCPWVTCGSRHCFHPSVNGNFRILKWRYLPATMYKAYIRPM